MQQITTAHGVKPRTQSRASSGALHGRVPGYFQVLKLQGFSTLRTVLAAGVHDHVAQRHTVHCGVWIGRPAEPGIRRHLVLSRPRTVLAAGLHHHVAQRHAVLHGHGLHHGAHKLHGAVRGARDADIADDLQGSRV